MIPTRLALARSTWKLPYTPAIANLREHAQTKKPIKTMARSADIIPAWKGLIFAVHNGKQYKQVQITEEMIGHKLGEFSHTRKEFTFRQTKARGR